MTVFKPALLAAAIAFSFHAQAQPVVSGPMPAFIELDLTTIGDKLVTYDTETRLEWLDVRLTERVSFNQTLLTSYVVQHRFRHATDSEVRELLANFGVTLSPFRTEANYEPIVRMLALLGPGYDSGTMEVLSGVYKAPTSNPIDAGWVSVSIGHNGPGEGGGVGITTADTGYLHAGEPMDGTGNFLVRRVDAAARVQQLLTFSTGTGPGKTLQNGASTAQTNYTSTCSALSNYRQNVTSLRQRGLITATQHDSLRAGGLAIKSAVGCE